MPLTKLTTDVENHKAQVDEPNDIGGLTSTQLKTLFDKAAVDIKAYINDTLTAEVDTHIANTSNPHSVTAAQVGALATIDGVANNGGNIDLIGGTGITITPNDTNNTITITATGESLPAAHASTHAAGESDEITPALIGAAKATDLIELAGTGRTTETVKGNADNLATHLADSANRHKASNISVADAGNHFTATDVEGALSELFTNVSNGKALIATAITDKNIATSSDTTFQQMATNIGMLDAYVPLPGNNGVLYDYGTENVSWGASTAGTIAPIKNADNIQLSVGSSQGTAVETDLPVDFTHLSTLHITIDCISGVSTSAVRYIGVEIHALADQAAGTNVAQVVVSVAGLHEYTIDVSALSGNYYVTVHAFTTVGNVANLKIYKVWGVK